MFECFGALIGEGRMICVTGSCQCIAESLTAFGIARIFLYQLRQVRKNLFYQLVASDQVPVCMKGTGQISP